MTKKSVDGFREREEGEKKERNILEKIIKRTKKKKNSPLHEFRPLSRERGWNKAGLQITATGSAPRIRRTDRSAKVALDAYCTA